MINLVRIDDRLIHGQVAVVWSKYLGVSRIVVANDQVVKDEIQKMALSMAVPSNIKATFKTIEESIKILNDERAKNLKIMVIVASPKDALSVIKEVPEIKEINIGNYGRTNNVNSIEKEQLFKNVFVTEEDKQILEQIKAADKDIYVQAVPTDTKEYI
ncbi:PTS system mannose/fructose/N-acetylgalactosamine-transporter subunit IIB [Amphibacillus sp. Q70]|uniref:PTS system mannose/fructose/N-acetylgalactosamine-transporter subunit IIB n=1 Tax=Amphibacillus sp. Q70 TaxID=3453416 RepID=UPI003F853875